MKNDKELILVIGYKASGKTTYVNTYIGGFYHIINTLNLSDILLNIHSLFNSGIDKIIFECTYTSIESRKPIIKFSEKYNIKLTCVHINTSFEDSQLNFCIRMVKQYGKLLSPIEIVNSTDSNIIKIDEFYTSLYTYEHPTLEEGFSSIETVNFKRIINSDYKNKALLLDYDGTLRRSLGRFDFPIHPNEIQLLDNRKPIIQKFKNDGYLLLGVSNQSGVHKKLFTTDDAISCFNKTNELLDFDIHYEFCPHSKNPLMCYCRKPECGIGAYFIEKYKLNPSECIMVGNAITDSMFAKTCGFNYKDQADFFNLR